MKFVTSTVVVSAVAALVAQQAGASPVNAEVVDGHLHLVAREPEAAVDAGNHRRHHAKRHAKTSCTTTTTDGKAGGPSAKYTKTKATSSTTAPSGPTSLSTTTTSTSSTSATTTAKPATTSTSSSTTSTTTSSNGSGSLNNGGSSSASDLGSVTAFAGENTNAILSWFRTDSSSDSTDGTSWCQTHYQDDWICFAPSVGTMLKEFNNDYVTAAKAFCGREAIVTNPATGKSITAFICDGFDDTWVRTPASLDLTVGAFTSIYGSFDNNKDTVIQGATWEFTGNVVAEGTFQS